MNRRRRISPKEAARREREAADQERRYNARIALEAFMAGFERVEVTGDEARRAWSLPEIRLFCPLKHADGSMPPTVVRGIDGEWFVQEPYFPGWRFFRLVPIDHDAHVAAFYEGKAAHRFCEVGWIGCDGEPTHHNALASGWAVMRDGRRFACCACHWRDAARSTTVRTFHHGACEGHARRESPAWDLVRDSFAAVWTFEPFGAGLAKTTDADRDAAFVASTLERSAS